MIFLDSSNFYSRLKAIGKSMYHIDFKKFVSLILISNRVLVKFFYYAPPVDFAFNPKLYHAQQRFWRHLESQGITIKRGYLQKKILRCRECEYEWVGITCPQCGHIFAKIEEKGVDVHIATDVVYHAAKDDYDIGYLISSDGDLAEACSRARDLGKRMIYICIPPVESMALKAACNYTARKDASFFEKCHL